MKSNGVLVLHLVTSLSHCLLILTNMLTLLIILGLHHIHASLFGQYLKQSMLMHPEIAVNIHTDEDFKLENISYGNDRATDSKNAVKARVLRSAKETTLSVNASKDLIESYSSFNKKLAVLTDSQSTNTNESILVETHGRFWDDEERKDPVIDYKINYHFVVELCTKAICKAFDMRKFEALSGRFRRKVLTIRSRKGTLAVLFPNTFPAFLNVRKLDLNRIDLKMIGFDAFINVPNLRNLSLQDNDLLIVEQGMFDMLKGLEHLHLENNNISYITTFAFGDMRALKTLHLSHNRLIDFYCSWFDNNPNLIGLYFDHNEISQIDDLEHLDLGNEATVDFSYNQINKISPNLNKSIWLLDLSYNNLTCIRGDLRTTFLASFVNLDNNPLECNCLKRIVNYAITYKHLNLSVSNNGNCQIISN